MTFRALNPASAKIYYALEADRPITTLNIPDGSLVIFTDSGLEDSFDAVSNAWFNREQIAQTSDGKTAGLVVIGENDSIQTPYATYTLNSLVNSESYLFFDAGTAVFTVGSLLTGGTTGHTGTIDNVVVTEGDWSTNDAKGYVQFSSSTGSFQNNETITDAAAGSATADGLAVDISIVDDLYGFQFGGDTNVRSYRLRAIKLSGGDATDRMRYATDLSTPETENLFLSQTPITNLNISAMPFMFLFDGEWSEWVDLPKGSYFTPLRRIAFLPEGSGVWAIIMEIS